MVTPCIGNAWSKSSDVIDFKVKRIDDEILFKVEPRLIDSTDNLGNKINKRINICIKIYMFAFDKKYRKKNREIQDYKIHFNKKLISRLKFNQFHDYFVLQT